MSTAAGSDARETPLVRAVRRALPAIVNIHSERTARDRDSAFDGNPGRKVNGMGTGVVVDERGYIVTNQHVINGVDSLRVTLYDGSTYSAEAISYDVKHDLAVIKIEASRALPVIPAGTSSDLRLGESVIAVGNAFGYEHTVTAGIISSLSRDVEVNEHQSYKNLLQTDASINPGNSGGPLLNLDGEVVGINVAIRAGAQRIGFAIPIDDARRYIAKLLNIKDLSNTWHGLISHDVKTPEQRKLVVDAAEANSPAAAAGFRPGDVVTQIGAITVRDQADLERAFLGRAPKAPIEVVVERNHETVKLTVELAARLDESKSPNFVKANLTPANRPKVVPAKDKDSVNGKCWDVFGLKLEKVAPAQLGQFRNRYRGGMRVVEVRGKSPAGDYGIKKGDMVLVIHGDDKGKTGKVLRVLKDKPQLFAGGKLTTYDPEKSGFAFMLMTHDEKYFPQFWELAAAFGRGTGRFYPSSGTMIERITSGEHLLGFNVIGSYVVLRQKKDPDLGLVYPGVATLAAAVGFGSSDNLAGAYGIAVSLLMAITTFLAALVAIQWGFNPILVIAVNGFFLIVDLIFLSANSLKLLDGGWFPLILAINAAALYLASDESSYFTGELLHPDGGFYTE
jgi:serine protease Do